MGIPGVRVADWLQWESADRQSAWSGLREVSAVVCRGVGSRFRLQTADREDLAADVFCFAVDEGCARLRGLDGSVCLPAWLWGVARNFARKRARARETTALWGDDLAGDGGRRPAPDAEAAVREPFVLELDQLLSVLTPAQREVEIALLAGQSERAIARALKISRNAVRERITRGRLRIRRRVEGAGASGSARVHRGDGGRATAVPSVPAAAAGETRDAGVRPAALDGVAHGVANPETSWVCEQVLHL